MYKELLHHNYIELVLGESSTGSIPVSISHWVFERLMYMSVRHKEIHETQRFPISKRKTEIVRSDLMAMKLLHEDFTNPIAQKHINYALAQLDMLDALLDRYERVQLDRADPYDDLPF